MDKAKFFASVRASGLFGATLSQSEADGTEAIIDAFEDAGLSDHRWLAYMLATAFHETAFTMQPIAEYGKGAGRKYGLPVGPFKKIYYGRGYVQLTWEVNYKRAQDKLGALFHSNPELALLPKHAADIMIRGMTEGWFTGKKLSDYLGAKTDYVNARRIINGTDKAQTIAGYAQKFEAALKAGGEIKAPPVMPNPFDADPAPERDNPPAHPNLLTALVEMLKAIFRRRT
jgi:putative chitinase